MFSKTNLKNCPFLKPYFLFFVLVFCIACEDKGDAEEVIEEEPVAEEEVVQTNIPTLSTVAITEIEITSAVSGGEITSDGNSPIVSKGVCWGTSPQPTLVNDFTEDGSGDESFVSELTYLEEDTTYYVRAYATNAVGTAYGDEIAFTIEIDHVVFEGDILLETQDDVDVFGSNAYTKITGSLNIGVFNSTRNNPQIENLEPLNSLRVVEGNLVIASNYNLETLEGLNSISSIGGTLSLNDNRFLEDIGALGNLYFIGDNLFLNNCWLLKNIDALKKIRTINKLVIIDADIITSLDGLLGLREIRGDIFFESNGGLKNIDGLENVTSVGGDIIFESSGFDNIDGLQNVITIGGSLFSPDGRFDNIDGLKSLESITGTLDLFGSFNTVDALRNLKTVGGDMYLRSNSLSNIDGLENLNSVDNRLFISGLFSDVDALSNLQSVGQDIFLNSSNLNNIDGLNHFTSLNGRISIIQSMLVNLDALENLTAVGSIELTDNGELVDFCGLRPLMDAGFSGTYLVNNNAFNPTQQDIIDGNCNQ